MIVETLHRLRTSFEAGRTRPLAWRRAQLALVEQMLEEREAEFAEALRLDLNKSRYEAFLSESSFVLEEAKYARRHVARWMRGDRVRTPMIAQPGRSRIVPEPKQETYSAAASVSASIGPTQWVAYHIGGRPGQ